MGLQGELTFQVILLVVFKLNMKRHFNVNVCLKTYALIISSRKQICTSARQPLQLGKYRMDSTNH